MSTYDKMQAFLKTKLEERDISEWYFNRVLGMQIKVEGGWVYYTVHRSDGLTAGYTVSERMRYEDERKSHKVLRIVGHSYESMFCALLAAKEKLEDEGLDQ